MSSLTKPTVHLNGTSARDLLEQFLEARRAIEMAKDACKQAYPNGRDYYPQGEAALTQAQNEHWGRINKLEEVAQEFMQLAEHVDQFVK